MDSDTSFWNGKRVLVTGANGFIGAWLIRELLACRAAVVGLIRDSVTGGLKLHGLAGAIASVQGDVTDSALLGRVLGEYEIDSVFHLAAQSLVPIAQRSPFFTFETNVRGTWTLLEQCRLSGAVRRIVVSTSDKVYGRQTQPAAEESPLLGVFPYEASKVCADVVAHSYAVSFNMPVVAVRFANVYGGGDLNYSRIVPYAVRNVLLGQPIVLRSDGSLRRELIYVEDVARALLCAGQISGRRENRARAFNFGSGETLDVLALLERVFSIAGKTVEVVRAAEPPGGEIPEQSLVSLKAGSLLGWKPEFDLNSGLSRTIAWYSSYLGC
jgi:CDP-glucose 4,6-dehydratase